MGEPGNRRGRLQSRQSRRHMLGDRLAGRLALTGLFFAGSLAAAVLPPFPSALGGAGGCDVPDELMQVDDKLPHLAERLRAGEPVKIVAIGGASTSGLAWGSSHLAYPPTPE